MASTTEQGLSTDHSRASADGAHTHGQNPDAAAAAGASRANRFASHDLALFAPVSGSEEEWRFSPVDRLQRLFDGEAASGRIPVEVSAAPGVLFDARARSGAATPAVRLAAPASRQCELSARKRTRACFVLPRTCPAFMALPPLFLALGRRPLEQLTSFWSQTRRIWRAPNI